MVPTQSTSLIGSRLIDFSLYWNWCRWFSVLLLCKSNSYVLEMMNDEGLGMECTSQFLLFFRENENSRKYAHALFLDICHHKNNITYMHNTFWHLHIWIFQTETFLVILRKRWTSSNILLYVSFFFIHTKKINRMMGFFPIFIKVFFFVIADVLQNCVEMWILKMQIFFFNPRPFFIISI